MNDEGGIERPSTATASRGESTTAPSAVEDSFLMAGKRSGKGTRVGTNDTSPLPGTPSTDKA